MDAMETLENFRLTSEPNKSNSFYDREIGAAFQKVGKQLTPAELDEIMHLVARDRHFAIPEIFRKKDLPAAHAPLLDGLDQWDDLFWVFHFLREGLRRDRIMEATSIYNDLARYTSIPGARKKLPDIIARHSVDAPLLEAMQVSVERPERMPRFPGGGVHRPIICAWLAIDGSARSRDSLRRYAEILAVSGSYLGHVCEIVREYAADDATRALADELTLLLRD